MLLRGFILTTQALAAQRQRIPATLLIWLGELRWRGRWASA